MLDKITYLDIPRIVECAGNIKVSETTMNIPCPYGEKDAIFGLCIPFKTLKKVSMINYNNKTFKPVVNSENGETSSETVFVYKQTGNILTAEYAGGKIIKGHLIGLVGEHGAIEMRYHQINQNGELMTGICTSKPEMLENGKIRLHERWEWTSGDQSKGQSILQEQ